MAKSIHPTKNDLIKTLLGNKVLKSERLRRALRTVDRIDFVRREDSLYAYEDHPMSIGWGATISQPYTVALMLQELDPQRGERVLDVGAGSGWSAALLACLVGAGGEVWGTEVVPELVKFGQKNLKKYPSLKAKILPAASGVLGLPERAPFNRILVSAALPEGASVPPELLGQLAPGGRLLIPLGYSLWRIDKSKTGKLKQREFPGFIFVPLQK
jgi:protein-L-isoaspartate(D-aspartate) O-methyltransferase